MLRSPDAAPERVESRAARLTAFSCDFKVEPVPTMLFVNTPMPDIPSQKPVSYSKGSCLARECVYEIASIVSLVRGIRPAG